MSEEDTESAGSSGQQSQTPPDGQDGHQGQSQGHGQQPPQSQGRGQQPPQGGGESVTDAIDTDQVVYTAGILGIVSAWVGLAPLLVSIVADTGVALAVVGVFGGLGISVIVLLGPIVALFTGYRIKDRMDGAPKETQITAGVASGVGHLVMMIVAAVLVFLAADQASPDQSGGGVGGATGGSTSVLGTGDVGSIILPVILIAVATGLIGGLTAYFRDWSDRRSSATPHGTSETPR